MKLLINTPDIKMLGGVANHYKGLLPHWKCIVHYNHIGSRQKLSGFIAFPFDILKFIFKLTIGRYDIIILNPSLTTQSVIRDGIFLLIASLYSTKKIVFFHGWESATANRISKNPKVFATIYSKADCFMVLATSFKTQLHEWGIRKPVFLTSTKFDDRLIEGRDIRAREHAESLLFLARIEKEKGIFTALAAMKILQSDFPNLRLKVVGDGGALQEAKRFTIESKIDNVEFFGMLTGDKISDVFMQSDIYLLPTWSEGMPTSILEAMAFGLPVITRPVGGICDFFINEKMGELVESKNPVDFALAIRKILENNSVLRNTSEFNIKFSRDNFAASKVARDLESKFNSILEENLQTNRSK